MKIEFTYVTLPALTDRTPPAPVDVPLPELAQVRETENRLPPVADVPDQTFELRAPSETLHSQARLFR